MLLLTACVHSESALPVAGSGDLTLAGGTVVGQGRVDLGFEDGKIGEAGGEVVDVSGRWIVPAFLDSHVHLAYRPEAEALVAGGIAGAVDLAAPWTSSPRTSPRSGCCARAR